MFSRSIFFALFLSIFTFGIMGESSDNSEPKSNAITIGILQGGGGLIGIDYERLIYEGLGIQVGAGLVSVGAGLTYHFERTTNSNALWLGFWNQGIPGDTNSTAYVGVSYIMRGWNWLNGQIGIAYVPFRGDGAKESLKKVSNQDPPSFALLYSIGWYSGF